MFDIGEAIKVLNAVGLACFLFLLGAIMFSLLRRLRLYRAAQQRPDPILRRGIAMIGALAIIAGETFVLRFLGVTFDEASIERFLFILQADAIALTALAYYAKTEYDLDDPRAD